MKKIHDEFFFRKSLFTPSMYFSFSDNMIIDNKKFQLAIYLNSPILYQSIFMVEEKLKKVKKYYINIFLGAVLEILLLGIFQE